MQVEPAHIDQLRRARDGRMVAIDKDVGGVAEDLRRIDPCLKVRFAENGNPPFFAVYHESEDQRHTYLVLTVQAHMTPSGVWAGLDQRVVKRVLEIDSHGDYDYAKEIERQNQAAELERKRQFREETGPLAEQAAHALRKDLGKRYRGRIFLPRKPQDTA